MATQKIFGRVTFLLHGLLTGPLEKAYGQLEKKACAKFALDQYGDLTTTIDNSLLGQTRRGSIAVRSLALAVAGLAALSLCGCVHSQLETSSRANWTPRDRALLANTPYAPASIP